MSSKYLNTVQKGQLISGSPRYEATREALLTSLWSSVPSELVLPQTIIHDPPKNVTSIPKSCGILSADEVEITEKYDATSLAEAIASRKLSSVAVATAFAKRAIIAHQLTCCLSEWFMDEAIQQAKSLDEYLEQTGKTVGPLHGVPISIKEHMPIAGHFSSVGYLETRRKDEIDCHMMRILRKAGAVFYCKTNQPQSIMHLESHSTIGRVLNPHNINLSAGGSTGGEGALIAMHGSVLGVGTDIGGSIRGPAGFCGIYGFKPTSYTLPMKDFLHGGFGAELNVLCSAGPMCTSWRDMDLFMSVIASAEPYREDPRLIPLPWPLSTGNPKPKSSLKIGIMMDDGVIQPQPPVVRALEWVHSRLKNTQGVLLKPYKAYNAAEAMRNIRLAYWPDGGKVMKAHLEAADEPMYPLTQWIIKDAEGDGLPVSGVLDQRLARDEFRCNLAQDWEAQDIDFVISPVFVGPACQHDSAFYWNYTALWNYADYPSAVFPTPITAGAKGSETYASTAPLSDECKHVRQLWTKGDFEGAPINLQIVARRYHDKSLIDTLGQLKELLLL